MINKHTWWASFGKNVRIVLSLSYWNPLDELEIRRSIKISRFISVDIPFISVVIALLCFEMEWQLYIDKVN